MEQKGTTKTKIMKKWKSKDHRTHSVCYEKVSSSPFVPVRSMRPEGIDQIGVKRSGRRVELIDDSN